MSKYWIPGNKIKLDDDELICVLAKDIPAEYWEKYDRAWEVGLDNGNGSFNKTASPPESVSQAGRAGGTTQSSAYTHRKYVCCLIPSSFITPKFNDYGEIAP